MVVTCWNKDWLGTVEKVPPHYLSNRNVYLSFFEEITRRLNISQDLFVFKIRLPPAEDCAVESNSSASENNIVIHISDEHTVVLPGGRHLPPNSRIGRVPTKDSNGFYLVCLNYPVCVSASDIVLEYSNMNIQNLRQSGFYDESFLQKFVYIPAIPLLYEPKKRNHSIHQIMSTFYYTNPKGDRRTEVNEQIGKMGIPIDNVHYSSLDEYEARLDETQILLNVHQTPHHHTLEEFRVLPAILRGVIVVSEWVPLQEALPFKDYIIFAPYDDLARTAAAVYYNYSYYWQRFFGGQSKINDTLSYMRISSLKSLTKRVIQVANEKKILPLPY